MIAMAHSEVEEWSHAGHRAPAGLASEGSARSCSIVKARRFALAFAGGGYAGGQSGGLACRLVTGTSKLASRLRPFMRARRRPAAGALWPFLLALSSPETLLSWNRIYCCSGW